jgi:CDP-glucose 4,6-dehydratase
MGRRPGALEARSRQAREGKGEVSAANPLLEFYRGRTVLVTGHTGFKGGWLCAALKRLGARVTGLALAPDTDPNLFQAAAIGQGMESVLGDIRDLATVEKVLRERRPEIVFHNAAQPLVLRSYRQPVETYATNVMGTVHVLEAARRAQSVRAVVVVTSDKCYDNRGLERGYREDDPMGGHDPYSSSKGCAELVAAAYRASFFAGEGTAAIATARAGNVIGGGDWAQDRIVPDMVRGIMAGRPVVIRHPEAVRPWQHVLEPLRGYLMLGQRLYQERKFAAGWNFGPGENEALTVRQLAEQMVACWGAGRLEFASEGEAPHEAAYLKLDSAKARSELGWKPALTPAEALRWTVEWYRAYAGDPAAGPAVTTAQLERYLGLGA